jgi:hypothetical protein
LACAPQAWQQAEGKNNFEILIFAGRQLFGQPLAKKLSQAEPRVLLFCEN